MKPRIANGGEGYTSLPGQMVRILTEINSPFCESFIFPLRLYPEASVVVIWVALSQLSVSSCDRMISLALVRRMIDSVLFVL